MDIHRIGWAERFARTVTTHAGSTLAFLAALGTIIVWALLGPVFDYSSDWQLVINTGTTIVTFLMIFLIQRTQNKDSQAIHLKLNEIVAALNGASNRMICVEDLSEEDVRVLSRHFHRLAERAKQDESLTESHSIEEAEERHQRKKAAN